MNRCSNLRQFVLWFFRFRVILWLALGDDFGACGEVELGAMFVFSRHFSSVFDGVLKVGIEGDAALAECVVGDFVR